MDQRVLEDTDDPANVVRGRQGAKGSVGKEERDGSNSIDFDDCVEELGDGENAALDSGQRSVGTGAALESASRACMSNVTMEKERMLQLSVTQYTNMLAQSISEQMQAAQLRQMRLTLKV